MYSEDHSQANCSALTCSTFIVVWSAEGMSEFPDSVPFLVGRRRQRQGSPVLRGR